MNRYLKDVKLSKARLSKSQFFRNVAKLFAGNISAQSIAFLAAPIITRLFTPIDFGTMALIESSIVLAAVVANLRYERAIMLPKEDNDAEHILGLCILSNIIISLIVLLIISVAKESIASLLGDPDIEKWLWFVPIGVFLFGVREPLTYWFGRKREFGIVAWAQFSQSSWSVLTKIIAGLIYGSTAAGLIIGNLNGFLFSAVPLLLRYFKEKGSDILKQFSMERFLSVAKEYKKFPIFSSWTALANAFAENIPVFLLSYYYSATIVGYFALANKMLRKPIALISTSITKVLLEKIARLNANGDPLDIIFKKATLGLGAIAVVPLVIILFLGPQLFSLCFGDRWYEAGNYARLLSPWLFFAFMAPPANQVITVRQKLKFNLVFHIGIAVSRFCAIVIGSKISEDPAVPLAILSFVSASFFLFYILFAYHLVAQEDPQKTRSSSDMEFPGF